MRDLLLTAIVVVLIPLILRTPRYGAYAWAWLSMMNPHRATWGFARNFPFAYTVALSTLIGFLFTKERKPFPVTPITVVYLSFWFWMTFTCLFAMNSLDVVLDRWIFVSKIHLMLMVTLMLIRGREQIEGLVWVVTASIGFYGVKGGVWTLLTGGGSGRVWGPPDSMIQDNNGLALALVILVPFVYYLYQVSSRRIVRWGLVFSGVAICFAILGSHSRGALLALIAMAFMLAIKGKRPVVMSFLLVAVLSTAILSMPENWTSRMESIQNYEQDASAMSRITTWKTIWNLVMDRPIVGSGFHTDNPLVFALYAPPEWGGGVLVAHSIYFEVLGEHGFPGLFLYLGLFFLSWMRAGKLARLTRDDPEFGSWVPLLMRMVQVSLTGFAVGGTFLSLVHFDLPYYILSFVILVDATVRQKLTGLSAQREV
jgi:probable O-glycosylation ligase (exosortase A-associated)